DILGSVPIRLWLRELHNSTTNWSSGPCIPKAQRDELLVLPVQRRCHYDEFYLRCPGPRLDALFSSNRVSIHSNNRTQRWGCRPHPDHGLNNNVFSCFGHPDVYIVLFPAIGVIADVIPSFTRRPLYGSKYVIGSMIAAAVISFIVWGHHMFVTGIGLTSTKLYTVTTIAVSLPFDVMVIAMIETLIKARVKLKAAALFALGAIALF